MVAAALLTGFSVAQIPDLSGLGNLPQCGVCFNGFQRVPTFADLM